MIECDNSISKISINGSKCLICLLFSTTTSDRNRNRKLDISTAPTKAKSPEPTYSQALVQNKIDRHRVRSRESGR